MKGNRLTAILLAAVLLTACGDREAVMFPDYRGVSVPCNIAPLNFHYDRAGFFAATTFSAGETGFTIRGRKVRWKENEWKRLLEAARGDSVRVSGRSCGNWAFHVSPDSIDQYLTYRLIEPGYEVWDRVEIRERNVSNFEERTISDWRNTGNSCMNCHIHKGNNSIFYLRGEHGGAFYARDGQVRKLNLSREGMISGAVYGDIHPSGRWGVFSTNKILAAIHSLAEDRMEVFDSVSDLVVVDFENNRICISPEFARADKLETFPCFSADGTQVYFCSADSLTLPRDIRNLRYSILRSRFDASTGGLRAQADTVWSAAAHNASACHPKASPDGRWLLYTVADYGTFPIWHRECGLEMIDLADGRVLDMGSVNSGMSDSYHSWSSNSRWFVFASKRGDGIYGRPYVCHVDADGNCSKPFLLPQEDSYLYLNTLKSFNIPDLGIAPAPYDAVSLAERFLNIPGEVFN